MGQKEVDQLRALIKQRADLLQKIKKAKGKKLEDLKQDLAYVQSGISKLDEKQN